MCSCSTPSDVPPVFPDSDWRCDDTPEIHWTLTLCSCNTYMHADILLKRTVKEPYFARLLKCAITAAVPVYDSLIPSL